MDKETKEPKCNTCGDTGEVPKPMPAEPHPCNYVNLKRAERTIPCPTCNGVNKLPWTHPAVRKQVLDTNNPEVDDEYPCPDCQQSEDSPNINPAETISEYPESMSSNQQPSSEFTKTIRHNLRVQGRSGDTHRLGNVYATKLIEACKIIETSEQQRKDLLEACKTLRDILRSPSMRPMLDGEEIRVLHRAEAVIIEAEKGSQ